jgi:hypothetical protein
VYLEELRVVDVPVHFALLMPDVEVSLDRVARRESVRRMPEAEHRLLHAQFVGHGAFAGCTIDTTKMTPDQAGDAVMAAIARGECLVSGN